MSIYLRYLVVLLLPVCLLPGCQSEEDPVPGFKDPPASYYLTEEVVVIEGELATFADQNFFSYNDRGKLKGDGIFYNELDQLVQSPWPNRTVLAGLYYYSDGKADSIVTYGHPTYTLYYDLFYEGDRISRVDVYRRNNDEPDLNLVDELIITYPSENEILVIKGNITYRYGLDKGHSPYPYEYRLSHWWWPYSQNISLILTDRNVKTIIVSTDGALTNEVTFDYEYNEYGFPVSTTLGNRSVFFKYSESID